MKTLIYFLAGMAFASGVGLFILFSAVVGWFVDRGEDTEKD